MANLWKRLGLLVVGLSFPATSLASDSDEGIDFFEKSIRPLLIEHCYKCHSDQAKNPKGNFRLDSRESLLAGGDTGPGLVPGEAEKSLLIKAVSYKDVDLQMPPKGRLSERAISDLTKWVKLGAPWPNQGTAKTIQKSDFDLQKRKKEHWSWQPIQNPTPPAVKNTSWPQNGIDRFILSKLESKGLSPAQQADKRTLIRRLYFDLIGLPPKPEEITSFVNDLSPKAWENRVNHLLNSPHFGERWGRHWLDLVRYGESRGHEFDPNIPNAFQYRDYVIRALNRDVPYNQLVMEHLAGDLLSTPRTNPQEGFNESILGTGFWFLGEEVHSPVDIRGDQADRFDNRIDVFSKTFLGLTVSCARCHDHKFDAISTKDYYALFGLLESSNYRLVRFDTQQQHQQINNRLAGLRKQHRKPIQTAWVESLEPTIHQLGDYLFAAKQILQAESEKKATEPIRKQFAEKQKLDLKRLDAWVAHLRKADKNENDPFYLFAKLALQRASSEKEAFENFKPLLFTLQNRLTKKEISDNPEVVIDYSSSSSEDWMPDGPSYGTKPVQAGEIRFGDNDREPIKKFFDYAAAEKDPIWNGLKIGKNSENDHGALGGVIRSGRTIRTPTFQLKNGKVYALVKGRGMIYAAVGNHIMLHGPLHGALVQPFDTGNQFQWVGFDWSAYKGQRLHLEFTSTYDKDFGIAKVIQSEKPPTLNPSQNTILLTSLMKSKSTEQFIQGYQDYFSDLLKRFREDRVIGSPEASESARLANWLLENPELVSSNRNSFIEIAKRLIDEQTKLIEQIPMESRLAIAIQEGSGVDENVFIRGSHKALGEVVPRRLPEALVGTKGIVSRGSGRLELAQQLIDPHLNPFISRVMVNRIWYHLTGRGIVGSVDNFGVLGEQPTHPELLDHLAQQFVKEGWSIKQLIREIVTSKTYQMASLPNPEASQIDPENLLLHRMRIRRLEGEAIRDSMLSVSGRLDLKMFGPSVPIYLTDFMEGRGRPSASGSLDGDGRRSIYVAIRRNFLSPMMLAFDTPSPFSTVGKRTVSNVPAQALILMNDPFVHQQSSLWGKRAVSQTKSIPDRIRWMYETAFARLPSESELSRAEAFIEKQAKLKKSEIAIWTDFAHVLMNVKEFIFLN